MARLGRGQPNRPVLARAPVVIRVIERPDTGEIQRPDTGIVSRPNTGIVLRP